MSNVKLTVSVIASMVASPSTANQLLVVEWVDWIMASPVAQQYDGGIWPTSGMVSQALVPQQVWNEQREWAQRIVRPPWVPSDLVSLTFPARFLGDDELCYSKSAEGWTVQAIDDAAGLTLVCKPSTGLSGDNGQRVREALRIVTKFPEDKLSILNLRISENTISGHAGFTFIGSALGSTPIGEHAWWQHFVGLSDGRSVLIRFTKFDGTQRPIAATIAPTGRLRFNIQ